MKTSILIPAYNESGRIGPLVRKIKSMGFSLIVVDDGSTDATAKEAKASGAEIIRNERNMGKGAALKAGFEYVLKNGYDTVLIMDGDGQHEPDDIHKFIDMAAGGENMLIIGNRMENADNMPLDRKFTNMFMSFIVSCVCGQKIPDSQCGFRLLKKELLENMNVELCRFEVESEILVKASRAGAKIASVPIKTLYGKEASQINPILDGCRFIFFLLRLPFMK